MNPKITIILPTYNRKILLRRALNSIPLSKDYQVIMIDDGSTDGSWHLIEEWFKTNKDKNVDEPGVVYPSNDNELVIHFEDTNECQDFYNKLLAWKRLKDKGFRFTSTPGVGSLDITPGKFQIEINADMPAKWFCCDAVQKDLEVCFGGEE